MKFAMLIFLQKFLFSLVYFAEKGLDNDRRSEHGEGRKALDLVNKPASLSDIYNQVKYELFLVWKKR